MDDHPDLIVFFPAAGAGGSTLDQLRELATRREMAFLALPNPNAVEELRSGRWRADALERVREAAEAVGAVRVVVVGHCMGGLAAVGLVGSSAGSAVGRPVGALVVNTPCPDASGQIPTMTQLSDARIAEVLAGDGFPADLLEDEDMLAEIADGLRAEAAVADGIAEWVSRCAGPVDLHVLSTRGDGFIRPDHAVGWWQRVSGELRMTVTDGGHAIDETSIDVLERSLDSVLAALSPALVPTGSA
ncbi:MAG: hypothetical protein DLM58_06230 [Pseudonocardiales bacterium]|nr:MAG: hypothetical protein DLM58_06230 [Pseudonocardiales bacterium]